MSYSEVYSSPCIRINGHSRLGKFSPLSRFPPPTFTFFYWKNTVISSVKFNFCASHTHAVEFANLCKKLGFIFQNTWEIDHIII